MEVQKRCCKCAFGSRLRDANFLLFCIGLTTSIRSWSQLPMPFYLPISLSIRKRWATFWACSCYLQSQHYKGFCLFLFCKSMLTPFRVYSSGKEFRSKFIINIFPPPNWFQWPEKNLSNLQAYGILQMFQVFFADSTPFKMLVEVVAENESKTGLWIVVFHS